MRRRNPTALSALSRIERNLLEVDTNQSVLCVVYREQHIGAFPNPLKIEGQKTHH